MSFLVTGSWTNSRLFANIINNVEIGKIFRKIVSSKVVE